LIVRHFDKRIGILSGTADRGIIFRYDTDYLDQSNAYAISDYLHISESNTLKLLEALGAECAETISFQKEDEEYLTSHHITSPLFENRYRTLEISEIAKMIDRMTEHPLLIDHMQQQIQERISLLISGHA
jgi:hypothetical protein